MSEVSAARVPVVATTGGLVLRVRPSSVTMTTHTSSDSAASSTCIPPEPQQQSSSKCKEEQLVLCRLCLADIAKSAMHQLAECRCRFCEECVTDYAEIQIREGNVLNLTCPDGSCRRQGMLTDTEIESLVSEECFERYTRLKLKHEVDLDPDRCWCPAPGCDTICHVCTVPPPSPPVTTARHQASPSTITTAAVAAAKSELPQLHKWQKSRPVHCTTCNSVFCSVCKGAWHNNLTCDESRQRQDKSDSNEGTFYIPFVNFCVEAVVKRCPLCRVPIEREDGCAQMMCRRCHHVFCWYCLESLDDDFLLRHYDRGPCKNKLGHSRASVLWHRTQVVGIFAGFGVLLLVASPFLLLAAPCILCCKTCKSCRTSPCCHDDDDGEDGEGEAADVQAGNIRRRRGDHHQRRLPPEFPLPPNR